MTRPGDLVYDIIGGDTDHSQALLQVCLTNFSDDFCYALECLGVNDIVRPTRGCVGRTKGFDGGYRQS